MSSPENYPSNNPNVGSSELTPVTISPTIWHAAQNAVKRHDQDVLTMEDYETLLQEQGVQHADGSSLAEDELLATFEGLQEISLVAKAADEEHPGVYGINKPDNTPRPYSPKPLGYGKGDFDNSRVKRSAAERRDQILTRGRYYKRNAKAAGRVALRIHDKLLSVRPAPESGESIARREQEAEIDRDWAAQRQTRMVFEYEPIEAAAAKQPIFSMSPRIDPYAMYGQGRPEQNGRRAQEEGGGQRYDARRDPDYAHYFDAESLDQLDYDIEQRIRDEAHARKDARGINELPKKEFAELTQQVRQDSLNSYAGEVLPAAVMRQLEAALYDIGKIHRGR